MADSGKVFSAKVNSWVAETKARMLAVRNESIQRLVERMQTPVAKGGNMPVDTGFLRSSIAFSTGQPVTTVREHPNPKAAPGSMDRFDAGELTTVLLGSKLGAPIYAVYTAVYARRQEYGFVGKDSLGRTFNQAGRRFVGLAAQQWPQIVKEVATEATTRGFLSKGV